MSFSLPVFGPYLFALPILFLLFFQDLRHRIISAWLPVLLFLIGFIGGAEAWLDKVYSILLVTLHLLFIYTYFYIRNKGSAPFFNESVLGMGDVWVLLAFAPFFNFLQVYLFLFSGAVFSGIFYLLVIKRLSAYPNIPLAGIFALYFALYYPLCKYYGLSLQALEALIMD